MFDAKVVVKSITSSFNHSKVCIGGFCNTGKSYLAQAIAAVLVGGVGKSVMYIARESDSSWVRASISCTAKMLGFPELKGTLTCRSVSYEPGAISQAIMGLEDYDVVIIDHVRTATGINVPDGKQLILTKQLPNAYREATGVDDIDPRYFEGEPVFISRDGDDISVDYSAGRFTYPIKSIIPDTTAIRSLLDGENEPHGA